MMTGQIAFPAGRGCASNANIGVQPTTRHAAEPPTTPIIPIGAKSFQRHGTDPRGAQPTRQLVRLRRLDIHGSILR